ncbi:ribonuclease M5 [Acholeplasma granularum]|uniref:ribonuclease M5 n=1 Tax=Acholeplasma granularum TaxID=264635 RepID=UPI00046FE6D5|nr:ribonuclease M5 [Acholeplasma granularum]
MKNKLYVVEGIHDEALLKKLDANIKTISVGGSEIKKDVLDFLITHQDKFEIVLMFDPDHAGERIRKKISQKLLNPTHIFIQREKAISKNNKKIGVEHLSYKDLKETLNHEIKSINQMHLTLASLYNLGLTGKADSKAKRKILSHKLHIGHTNSKTLLERLNWLGITEEDIRKILYASS